jgi:hypothetical protein
LNCICPPPQRFWQKLEITASFFLNHPPNYFHSISKTCLLHFNVPSKRLLNHFPIHSILFLYCLGLHSSQAGDIIKWCRLKDPWIIFTIKNKRFAVSRLWEVVDGSWTRLQFWRVQVRVVLWWYVE